MKPPDLEIFSCANQSQGGKTFSKSNREPKATKGLYLSNVNTYLIIVLGDVVFFFWKTYRLYVYIMLPPKTNMQIPKNDGPWKR